MRFWATSTENPDLEDDSNEDEDGEVDEPSLGWTTTVRQEGQHWLGDRLSTKEPFVDAELDDADREPSLASPENHPSCFGMGMGLGSQTNWARGGTRDLEEQCEDEGAQVDS